MEIRLERKKARALAGVEPVLNTIEQRLHSEPDGWLKQLQSRPESFLEVEKAVHRAFQQMADQVMAGLLAEATAPPAFADAAKKK